MKTLRNYRFVLTNIPNSMLETGEIRIDNEESNVAIIVASSDALGTTKLANMALRFFGKEGYNISTLGLLGPFKKLN